MTLGLRSRSLRPCTPCTGCTSRRGITQSRRCFFPVQMEKDQSRAGDDQPGSGNPMLAYTLYTADLSVPSEISRRDAKWTTRGKCFKGVKGD
jgi:hypothetical protein